MEKESHNLSEKRPFEDTKRFVETVYNESYHGERELLEDKIDFNKPYTQVGEKYFQAEFTTRVMSTGDELPLTTMSVNARPNPRVLSFRRRPNTALLYLFADEKDINQELQTLRDIGKAYGVSGEASRKDVQKSLSDIHQTAKRSTRKEFALDDLSLRRPVTLVSRINHSLKAQIPALEIHKRVVQGVSTTELINEFGAERIVGARKRLKSWGLTAPERIRSQRRFRAIA